MVAAPVPPSPVAPGTQPFRNQSAGLRNAIAASLTWLVQAHRISVARRSLGAMDDRMLADIGASHAQAKEEASRRFWDTG